MTVGMTAFICISIGLIIAVALRAGVYSLDKYIDIKIENERKWRKKR